MTIEEYQQEVKRIRPGLCRTAIRYLGEADGEDAVEVTLVRLWQMADDLRTPFNALAQTLLRNHCIDVLRRRHITVALDGHDIAVDEEQDQRVETMMKLATHAADGVTAQTYQRHGDGTGGSAHGYERACRKKVPEPSTTSFAHNDAQDDERSIRCAIYIIRCRETKQQYIRYDNENIR